MGANRDFLEPGRADRARSGWVVGGRGPPSLDGADGRGSLRRRRLFPEKPLTDRRESWLEFDS